MDNISLPDSATGLENTPASLALQGFHGFQKIPGSGGHPKVSAGPPGSDQLQLEGLEHRPGAVAHAQLGEDVGHVVLDGALRHAQ